MKVSVKDFITNYTQTYSVVTVPIFLNIKTIDEFEQLNRFANKNKLEFFYPLEEQAKEYKEVYSMFLGHNRNDYEDYLNRCLNSNSLEPGPRGEFVFFNWGQAGIFNILPHKMHYDLLTWRNKDKITEQEQGMIAKKTVAIVGSSVGSFVSKILSKSGIQYLKMAEPKNIKPSNTPRLYTDSIRNYGVHKLNPLAQSIYEFNPYSTIEVFDDGVNDSNIAEFLKGVDIVIDAADDPFTKTLIHNHCEKKSLPLVYGFDERGSLIIHRYDKPYLNTYLPPRFSESELNELNSLSRKDYILRLLDFIPDQLGCEKLSPRQKLTIDGMISGTRGGFSQLAWEASLFGSYVSKAVLDILLGEDISGFIFLDLDKIISIDLRNLMK